MKEIEYRGYTIHIYDFGVEVFFGYSEEYSEEFETLEAAKAFIDKGLY